MIYEGSWALTKSELRGLGQADARCAALPGAGVSLGTFTLIPPDHR